ncbi:MAG: hypothetical protein CMJ19_23655 [Phycisphaeraceae bacterium]|nr:hypothetical protein [Phycisphaeraceae bacterium]
MRFWQFSILFSIMLLTGCSTIGQTPDVISHHKKWALQHGGILVDQRHQRLNQTCHRLAPACHDIVIDPHVLDSNNLAAYSWPNGELYVTRGMIDAASPDELASVVAHEIGHLIAHHNHSDATTMLLGQKHDVNPEIQSDALGCRILAACNISTTAMLHTLQKVKQSTPTHDPAHALLNQRILRLQSDMSNPFPN